MSDFTPILLSALLGLACVELFGGAWLGMLGMVAAAVLWLRGRICGRKCFVRVYNYGVLGLLRALALILAFVVYLQVLGLGFALAEMMAFFVGAVVGQVFFFSGIIARIDDMFVIDPD